MNADDRLDKELLTRGTSVESLVDLLAQNWPDQHCDSDVDRDRQQDNEGQDRRVSEQDGHKNAGEKQVDRGGEPLPSQKRSNTLEFAHPGDRLTGGPRLEVGQR